MNTSRQQIEVSGIAVEIVRKDIKNLHVGVYPPNGRVRVAAPFRLRDEAVRIAIVTRLGWIKRQQSRFAEQERQSPREMVSGETHYFSGRRFRLSVIERDARPSLRVLNRQRLELGVRAGMTARDRARVLDQWYRDSLGEFLALLIEKWQPRVGVRVSAWGIRKMKTRWGSCNPETGSLWFNVELAKKPPACAELIVIHELLHLRHRHHDEAFLHEITRLLPNWRALREELNRAPLGHVDWSY